MTQVAALSSAVSSVLGYFGPKFVHRTVLVLWVGLDRNSCELWREDRNTGHHAPCTFLCKSCTRLQAPRQGGHRLSMLSAHAPLETCKPGEACACPCSRRRTSCRWSMTSTASSTSRRRPGARSSHSRRPSPRGVRRAPLSHNMTMRDWQRGAQACAAACAACLQNLLSCMHAVEAGFCPRRDLHGAAAGPACVRRARAVWARMRP